MLIPFVYMIKTKSFAQFSLYVCSYCHAFIYISFSVSWLCGLLCHFFFCKGGIFFLFFCREDTENLFWSSLLWYSCFLTAMMRDPVSPFKCPQHSHVHDFNLQYFFYHFNSLLWHFPHFFFFFSVAFFLYFFSLFFFLLGSLLWYFLNMFIVLLDVFIHFYLLLLKVIFALLSVYYLFCHLFIQIC